MKPIKVITKVPEELFNSCRKEINGIDWQSIEDMRNSNKVFSTSTAIHLRVHDAPDGTPYTIEDLSRYVKCKDTRIREKFESTNELIDWVYSYVRGTRLGRIMIVKLSPGGEIGEHVDPGKYFEEHYRFHVPIITNEEVLFYSENKKSASHMKEGFLCQLYNLEKHSATNHSKLDRIHVIVDINCD